MRLIQGQAEVPSIWINGRTDTLSVKMRVFELLRALLFTAHSKQPPLLADDEPLDHQ
jgi:hypothetical protein